jgi:hypothetical protein
MGQPAYPTPADQVRSPQQQRDLFLQSALEKSIKMAPIQWSAGSTLQVEVPRTGLAQKIRVYVNLTISASTGTPSPTARAPYNLISRVGYLDPSGIRRIDCSAYELQLLMSMKRQWGFEPSNGNVGSWTSPSSTSSQVFNNPTLSTSNQTVCFYFDVPICMSRRDTRGTLLLESATSPSYLEITMNPSPLANASVESPYSAASGTLTITGTIQPVYYYWSPVWVQVNGSRTLPLPEADMAIIHELISVKGPSALQPSSENYYMLPTGRSFYRVIGQYVNNGAMDGTHLTDVKFRYDQSTYVLQEPVSVYYSRIREAFDRDFPAGVFLWDLVDRPWDSNQYGSIEAVLTLDGTSITQPAYLQYFRECLYLAPPA